MRFDLAEMAKSRGRRRNAELRPIAGRRSTEYELRRIILRVLEAGAEFRPALIDAAVTAQIGLTRDDDRLAATFSAFRSVMSRLVSSAKSLISQLLGVEAIRHDKKWVEQVNAAVGVDLQAIVTSQPLAADIDLATERNISLIKGLTDEVAKRVETAIIDMIVEGRTTKDIAAAIDAAFGFGRKRAAFIARDQAAKFSGNLNRIRQQEAGITTFIWWTVQDERVRGNPAGRYPNARPSHWDRHDKRYRWDSPPADGAPGDPVNCRCIARAVLDIEE